MLAMHYSSKQLQKKRQRSYNKLFFRRNHFTYIIIKYLYFYFFILKF